MVPDRIRQRFLRDPLPVRLAGLAADLNRIAACSGDPRDAAALSSLLEEGKWFAEWAAADAPVEVQEQLAEVQVVLARWQLRERTGKPPSESPEQLRGRSDQLLQWSGLAS